MKEPEAKKSNFLFASILLLGAGLRLWYALSLPYFVDIGDAMARLEQAQDWMDYHKGVPGGLIWLPLHHLLLILPTHFGFSLLAGGRCITLLLAILLMPLFYAVVKLRWGARVALFTLLLLAVNPFFIKYAVITMSETPFIFFITGALYGLYLFLEKKKLGWLAVSAICLNCANMMRFEGWAFTLFFTLMLLHYSKSIKYTAGYAVLALLTVVWYVATSLTQYGMPIYGLTMSDLELKYAHIGTQALPYIMAGLSYDKILPYWVLAMLLPAALLCFLHRKEIPWVLVASAALFMVAWKVFHLTSEPAWRYFSTGIFLCLPPLAYLLAALFKRSALVLLPILTVVLYVELKDVNGEHDLMLNRERAQNGFFAAASWAKQQRKQGDRVIYNGYNYDNSGFKLLAGLHTSEVYFPHYAGMKKFKFYEEFTDTVLLRLLQDPDYKLLLFKKGETLDSVLHSPGVQLPLNNGDIGWASTYRCRGYSGYVIDTTLRHNIFFTF